MRVHEALWRRDIQMHGITSDRRLGKARVGVAFIFAASLSIVGIMQFLPRVHESI